MTNVHLPDSVGKVAGEVYSDTASNTLQEASKIGVDAVKTIRLALAPLQLTAALQDRLARYIDKAIRQVPEENRTQPIESIFLPTAEKLKFQEESNPLTTLYLNLLSRSMDKERLGEAHPGFYTTITQLCPDEASYINHIALGYKISLTQDCKNILASEHKELLDRVLNDNNQKQLIKKYFFDATTLAQPSLFNTFTEHLYSLGILQYHLLHENYLPKEIHEDITELNSLNYCVLGKDGRLSFKAISLSGFGKIFYQTCCKN